MDLRRLIACAALLAAPLCLGQTSGRGNSQVIVVRRGWHIDVGFAAADIGPSLQFVAAALPTARFIFFGFGDRHYLEAPRHTASTLAAALWPGRGIMLVTGLSATPQQGFGAPHVIALRLSDAEASAMQAFIEASFVTVEGTAAAYEPGPYEGSEYFLATHHYSALHTCNTWAAEALNAGHLPVHHVGVLFAGQLWSQAKALQRGQRRQLTGAPAREQPGDP